MTRALTTMLLCIAMTGCGATFHGGGNLAGPHYRGEPAPMVEAMLARRQAGIERRELMRELRAIRRAIEDD